MGDSFEWECPDCEDKTNGSQPPSFCQFCGQGLIVRNLTLEEAAGTARIDNEIFYCEY